MTTDDAITLEELAGARVGVVGAGRTGLAVIEALADLGARIHLFDSRQDAADSVSRRWSGSPSAMTVLRPMPWVRIGPMCSSSPQGCPRLGRS